MKLTQKSGHFAWCTLVALALARQDGAVCSEAQENLFLTRWLATALKQRRFARELTPDIEWLLRQGRQHGVVAKLASKLDYLWRSCTSEVLDQNDLFRLIYAPKTAKEMQWTYQLLSDREWSERHDSTLPHNVNGIYLSRTSLDAAFDDGGLQVSPLIARLTGRLNELDRLFERYRWQIAAEVQSGHYFLTVQKPETNKFICKNYISKKIFC